MMNKLFIETDNLDIISVYQNQVEAFIISDESLIKKLDKNIRVALKLEKIYDDEMLNNINEDLLKRASYIFYSDLGIYHKLKDDYLDKLVYHAPTYLTNSNDVNYFNELNNFVVVSCEITSDELINIVNNSKKTLGIDLFGLSTIFYSRRLLLTNYFNYKGLNNDPKKDSYFIKEETRTNHQRIVEDENSTIIYDDGYYYLDSELKELDKDYYGLIHLNYLNQEDQKKIIDYYLKGDFNNLLVNLIDDICLTKSAYNNKLVLLKGDLKDE